MRVPEGNISLEAMQDKLRILRKLRAGLHGGRLHDDSDVSTYNDDGTLTGFDPHAQSRTVADMFRAAYEDRPRDWP